MVKILHLIWGIEGVGGMQQFCLNLKAHMDPSKYQFDFVVCGGNPQVTMVEHSRVYHLPEIKGKLGKKKYLQELKYLLAENKYEIVHSHLAFMNISSLRVAKEKGVKVRISHTHVSGFGGKYTFTNCLKRFLMNYYATDCIACSKETAEYYYGFSKKIRIIYSGVEIERFTYREDKNCNNFIVVARVCPEKNPEFILDIVRELFKKEKNICLVWCGGGRELSKLKERVLRENLPVVFTGSVPNIEDYLQEAAYMLMPSIKEGFGMAAIEAQLSGTFVFASDRIPKDTDAGLIMYLPINSAKEWANCIITFIKENKREEYCLNKNNLAKFSIRDISKIIALIYDKVLQ